MTTRNAILNQAAEDINGQRHKDYGDAHEHFAIVAQMWSAFFGIDIEPWQVPAAMTLLKVARTIEGPQKVDTWNDAAGYIALAGEVSTEYKSGVQKPTPSVEVAVPAPVPAVSAFTGSIEIVIPPDEEELNEPGPPTSLTSIPGGKKKP